MSSYITDTVTFGHLFEESPKTLQEYIANTEKEWLFRSICYLIGINTVDSYSYRCQSFIDMFFQDYLENETVIAIKDKINKIQGKYPPHLNVVLTFTHPGTTLIFLRECLLLNPNGKSKESFEDLMNLFKAYLVTSENRVERLKAILNNIDKEDRFKDAKIHIAQGLQDFGLIEYNIHDLTTTQELKCLAFCNYLEKNRLFKNTQDRFLRENNFSNFFDFFLKAIFPLKVYQPSKFKEGFIALEEQDFIGGRRDLWNELLPFWNNISITITNIEETRKKLSNFRDYTCFKEYPLLKINDHKFLVVSPYYYALTLYDGFKQKVKSTYEKEYKGARVDFNSCVTSNFSEHILFYQIMSQMLGKNNYVVLNGKFFEERSIPGRPDLYIRNKKDIFIFEFKDLLINKEKKDSDNINEFINAICEKLNHNKEEPLLNKGSRKNKNKGIPQILSNIEDIMLKEFDYDRDYRIQNIRIYPVLVINNRLLSIDGINYLMNEWFQERIGENPVVNNHKKQIMPLLVIDLDFLILISTSTKNHFEKFKQLHHSYQTNLKNTSDVIRFPSFRNFILNKKKLNPAEKSAFSDLANSFIK